MILITIVRARIIILCEMRLKLIVLVWVSRAILFDLLCRRKKY